MKELLTQLNTENSSLIVKTVDGRIQSYYGRGVSDLYRLCQTNIETLQGAIVADKVVGKGSAALMAYSGVKKCITNVVSQEAYALLLNHGINVSASTIAEKIVNRTGIGRCPLEVHLDGKNDLKEIYLAIGEFLDALAR